VEEPVRRRSGRSKLAAVATLGILSIAAAISTALPAVATSGINVFVGYADFLRADPTTFPTPWYGSPQTTFEGCKPTDCTYDAGAVRVSNNTGSTVTVDAIAVHVDSCTYGGWAPAILASGADLIVTELPTGTKTGCPGPVHMDTSDVGPGGSDYSLVCTPDGILPTVDVTINGQTTSYTDSGQVLNTGGADGACTGNESTQWTAIGHAPCKGSLLSLAPAAQTHGVGTTAAINATFTNSCGQALSNVAASFLALSGPNAGRTGSGVTNANGVAGFSYSSQLVGTDTFHATVTNVVGTITSNTVTVTWLPFASAGGGAFVISDLVDSSGAHIYWWGAQWWKQDHLSTGLAPAAFKGFENSNASPWCGQTWTTRPGNSPNPPKTVPGMMLVIVSSHITKNGAVISGDIVHIVLVKTNPGYGPNPGHPGTGTVISQLC